MPRSRAKAEHFSAAAPAVKTHTLSGVRPHMNYPPAIFDKAHGRAPLREHDNAGRGFRVASGSPVEGRERPMSCDTRFVLVKQPVPGWEKETDKYSPGPRAGGELLLAQLSAEYEQAAFCSIF